MLIPCAAVQLILALVTTARAAATVTVTPLARQGDAAPDANGSFSTYFQYGDPVLNDAGEAAFMGRFASTAGGSADDDYLVRARRDGLRLLLARQGQALPDVSGTFGGMFAATRQHAMNDSGRVAFVTPRSGTPGGTSDNSALYSVLDPGAFWVHARRGDTPPFTATTFNGLFPPTINDQPPSAVAFFTSHGGSAAPVTVYTSRLGLLSPIAWLSRPAPDATDGDGINGALSIFSFAGTGDPPALRETASEIAFYAHLSGTTNASIDDDGVFRASPDVFVDIARGDQPAPGGGTYQEFGGSPTYNANGIAAFLAHLKPVPATGSIIALDWPGGGDLVAYSSQPSADGNGTISSLWPPSVNGHEAVVFPVRFTGTALGALDDDAIYKGDSTLLVVPEIEDQIARENQSPPEGGGVFASFGLSPAINDAGQVAFTANLRSTPGGTSDDRALYLWDPLQGLVKLLREGDVIDGRTVLQFSALVTRDFGGLRGLNEAGEVVARIQFVQPGGDGVYLFRLEPVLSAPPPLPVDAMLSLSVGPNPIGAGAIRLRWSGTRGAPVRALVLDAAGRKVRLLAERVDGDGSLEWRLDDDARQPVAAGIYIVLIESAHERRARRIAVVR